LKKSAKEAKMAKDNAGKVGAALASVALVASAIALAKEKVALAEPGGVVTLDQATMELLIAMAQAGADTADLVSQILSSIEGQAINLTVQGYPPNANSIEATRVQIAALNTAYQLPWVVVPEGMALQVKGWPTNGGTLYMGYSRAACINLNQVWPLLANEAIGYYIQNANQLFVSGNAVGDFAVLTVEQMRRA
jgi:hypothetical protein